MCAFREKVKGCMCALGGEAHGVKRRGQRVSTKVRDASIWGTAYWTVADGNGCRERDWLG